MQTLITVVVVVGLILGIWYFKVKVIDKKK